MNKFGNLTEKEVEDYFLFDWYSLFPDYFPDRLKDRIEFKHCVCQGCAHMIATIERDFKEGRLPKARLERLEQMRLRYSDQPQECRLFSERIYDRDCAFSTYSGGKMISVQKKKGDIAQVWYCADCFFGHVIDMILEDLYGDERHIHDSESFPDLEANFKMIKHFYENLLVEPFPCRLVKSPRDYILHQAEKNLSKEEYHIFEPWVQGAQQQQIADNIGKSIGYVNTRLRRIREGPMGFWFEDFVKGEGHRSGHGEPDYIAEDGTPVNLKCVGDKRTSKIKRDKLQPEINYAKAKGTKVRIRVYNIVHNQEQVLEYAPLEIPVEVQVDW